MAIDPCREWLGIDAVDLAQPHVVLGVDRDESNPTVITAAADTRLQSLRTVSPGPFEKAHAALLTRVAEARDQMLQSIAARPPAPTPPPRPRGLAAPPPPPVRAAAPALAPPPVPIETAPPVLPALGLAAFAPQPVEPVSAAALPPAVPTPDPPTPAAPPPVPPPIEVLQPADAAPPPVLPPPVPTLGSSMVAVDDSQPRVSRPIAPPPRSSNSGMVLATMALMAAIASGLGAYLVMSKGKSKTADRSVAAASEKKAEKQKDDGRQGAAKSGKDHAEGDGHARANAESARKEAEARRDEQRRHAEEQARRERERKEREAEQKARAEKERAASAMAAREKAEREAAEKAEREEKERLEREQALAAAKVDQSLRTAYEALQEDKFDVAMKAVDVAAKAATGDADAATRVERWRLLVTYAKQLVGYRNEAFASANEGREYQVGSRMIAIIEIGSSTFAYKESGQIKRGSRDSLPKAIERAILRQWFENDGRAANHIFLGVQYLVEDPPNLRSVRKEWETALKGEPATKSLMPLLDDPILRGGG